MINEKPAHIINALVYRYLKASGDAFAAREDEKAKNYRACADMLGGVIPRLIELPPPQTRS